MTDATRAGRIAPGDSRTVDLDGPVHYIDFGGPQDGLGLLALAATLVMALVELGLPPDRFQVDAVDISARALEHARRGIYGQKSFRGASFAFRDKFFRLPEPMLSWLNRI